MKELRCQISDEWHEELSAVAELQAISLSDLVRLILGKFLRNRYSDLEREVLN